MFDIQKLFNYLLGRRIPVAESLYEDVKNTAVADDVLALSRLVNTHGAVAVRLECNPEMMTAVYWAASSGAFAAVTYLLSAIILSFL